MFRTEDSANTLSGEKSGLPSQNLNVDLLRYSIYLDSPEVFKYLPLSTARNQSVQRNVFDS